MVRRYLVLAGIVTLMAAAPAVNGEYAHGEFQELAFDETWKPLYDQVDPNLQAMLETRIRANPEWRRLANQQKLAVCTVDLNGRAPRFARINGNHMMYAASLPKIAIMLGVYASLEDGTLAETPELHRTIADMIRYSSNSAATALMDKVGMRKINAVLQDDRFGFYDEARGGGMWVGKRYAKTGARVGDPLYNISHGATATQVCRFYYLLATNRLFSPARSAQMRQELVDPGLHHKFVSQLDVRAPDATVYRKFGTWRQWHADSVLVQGQLWRNYILVGLVESEHGEQILRALLPAVEGILEPVRVTAN